MLNSFMVRKVNNIISRGLTWLGNFIWFFAPVIVILFIIIGFAYMSLWLLIPIACLITSKKVKS